MSAEKSKSGKFKIGLQFDVAFLEKLCKKKISGVFIQKSKHHMVLHPIHLKNFSNSIKDMLNNGIAKYDTKLEGILLGYKNIKLISKNGVIHDDSSGIHINLESDFFIFKPSIGKQMEGVVNRKGKDFLGVLVYNTFNVSLPKPQSEDNWLGDDVHVGYTILFQIEDVDTSLHIPYIKGNLVSVVSKPVMADILENCQPKTKCAQRVLFEEKVTADSEVKVVPLKYEAVDDDQEVKVKKKRKKDEHTIENLIEQAENEIELVDTPVKKSKKRKTTDVLDSKKKKRSKIEIAV